MCAWRSWMRSLRLWERRLPSVWEAERIYTKESRYPWVLWMHELIPISISLFCEFNSSILIVNSFYFPLILVTWLSNSLFSCSFFSAISFISWPIWAPYSSLISMAFTYPSRSFAFKIAFKCFSSKSLYYPYRSSIILFSFRSVLLSSFISCCLALSSRSNKAISSFILDNLSSKELMSLSFYLN